MDDIDENRQWYVNTRTGMPERGMVSPITQRMGPYASYEDALRAREIVKERNETWEAQTKAWNAWGDDDAAEQQSDADTTKPADGVRPDDERPARDSPSDGSARTGKTDADAV